MMDRSVNPGTSSAVPHLDIKALESKVDLHEAQRDPELPHTGTEQTQSEIANQNRSTLITAKLSPAWTIDQTAENLYPVPTVRDMKEINQTLSQALTIFNDIVGPFPYVSLTFGKPAENGQQSPSGYTQIHLTRPQQDPEAIAVNIVPEAPKGARYSDISSRVFGNVVNGELRTDPTSVGEHITIESAREMLRYAERCRIAVEKFQRNDVVLQLNPQGVQEFVNQPLGGYKDTGGQNKYVECFARALGATVPNQKEEPPCQIILNRSGPSQTEILAHSNPPKVGGDPAVRKGVHFFPDENVCLAFVADKKPDSFELKENSHPRWKRIDSSTKIDFQQKDVVTVAGGKLSRFGIPDGTYLMTDPGPMKELAEASNPMLDYFKFDRESSVQNPSRKMVLANHYADAAYLGEFISREMQTRFKSFFFIHSLGTFKAEGLDYPNKLTSDVAGAETLEKSLRLTDRILGELWVVQRCKQGLIANSDGIAKHTHNYLGARHEPPTMIAVDDAANGHIARNDRRSLAMETFKEMHRLYLDTCNNAELGPVIPEGERLTLDQLIDSQVIFERSRHAEADSKGKWAVVKAMAIAQSDEMAQKPGSPNRVLVVNVNLDARHGDDEKFRNEINTIIGDIRSIRSNGGHVIVQPSFEYNFGLDVCKVTDCYMALPAFEPFGMGVLEAAAAGAPVIARSDVPSVMEILSNNTSTVKFPLRNSNIKVGIAQGAVLVGGLPQESSDPKKFVVAAYNGAAAAINAITLGGSPTTPALTFNPVVMGSNATALVQNSHYNWKNVAARFLQEVYEA